MWGAAFLLVTAYAWLGVQLARLFVRAPQVPAALSLSEAGLRPGSVRYGELRAKIPRRLPPAVRLDYLLSLTWHEERLGELVPLQPGEQRVTLELRAARRGTYTGPTGYLVFEDLFGLARSTHSLAGRRELRVYPEVPGGERVPPASELDGESMRRHNRRRASDDLIESRPYVAGDDPRRLNWKLYAHLGELLVRIGEHTPPPHGSVAVFLDTGFGFTPRRGRLLRGGPRRPSSAASHRAWSRAYCDRVVAQFCAAALELMQGGRAARVWWPALDQPKAIRADEHEWLLWNAAAIWWDDRPNRYSGAGATEPPTGELRGQTPGGLRQALAGFSADEAVVVAPAGSPTLASLLRQVRARCRNVTVRICDWPVRSTAGRPIWSKVLFTPPGEDDDAARGYEPMPSGERPPAAPSAAPSAPLPPADFEKRLESDILRYRRDEWRLREVVVT